MWRHWHNFSGIELWTAFPDIIPSMNLHSFPVPMAARSKAYVSGRLPGEIVSSNPTEGMDICLLWVLCVVRLRSLWQADHSSRGVLPNVVRRCVWSIKPREWGDLGPLGGCGAKNKQTFIHYNPFSEWNKERTCWQVLDFNSIRSFVNKYERCTCECLTLYKIERERSDLNIPNCTSRLQG